MSSIEDLLVNTLLRTQDPAAKFVQAAPTSPTVKKDTGRGPWAYELDLTPTPRVKDLSCFHPSMGHHMVVCKEISWDGVTAEVGATTFDLPLEEPYLLGHFKSEKGVYAGGTSWLWPLPADSDASTMLVYGYELMGEQAQPFSPGVLESGELMFSADALDEQATSDGCHCSGGAGDVHEVYVVPTRIIICVSIVCMKKRNNFDPQGALEACRFYPIYEILTNEDVGLITASLTYRRPEQTHGMEGMLPDLHAILFADANSSPSTVPDLPYWDNIFAYYDVGDVRGVSFHAVDSSKVGTRTNKTERYHKELITVQSSDPLPASVPSSYVAEIDDTITKTAYQGEFDNIHIAPHMTIEDGTAVVMAPICQHDCLHTHWRWGAAFDNKESLGWTSSGVPHHIRGAPLVPRNQDVYISVLKDAPGFTYSASLKSIKWAEIQVVNHHGSAYALEVDSGLLSMWVWAADGGWADWYRRLRYRPTTGTERVLMRNGKDSLYKLRKL